MATGAGAGSRFLNHVYPSDSSCIFGEATGAALAVVRLMRTGATGFCTVRFVVLLMTVGLLHVVNYVQPITPNGTHEASRRLMESSLRPVESLFGSAQSSPHSTPKAASWPSMRGLPAPAGFKKAVGVTYGRAG